jgi:histidine ammonia-lyase
MGATAARHARDVLDNVERILALELLVGAQALDLRRAAVAEVLGGRPDGGPTDGGPTDGASTLAPSVRVAPPPGAGVAEAHRRIRAVITPLDADREMGADIAAATRLVRTGALVDLVGD